MPYVDSVAPNQQTDQRNTGCLSVTFCVALRQVHADAKADLEPQLPSVASKEINNGYSEVDRIITKHTKPTRKAIMLYTQI